MAAPSPMDRCRDILACKCGEERHDVQYGQTRLVLTFISINLVAASLGLNALAETQSGGGETTLGRGNFVFSETFSQITTADNETYTNAEITLEYDFDSSDTCENVGETIESISESDCDSIIDASTAWVTMGVLATFTFAILFGFLLRVECRQLCSKPMRQVMLGIAFVGFTFTFVSWLVIVASPIPEKFDTLGSSVWLMICASISSLLCFIVSIMEYRGAAALGPAPAAKSY